MSEPLARTPLHALHAELKARFTPFAGYEMPVQYPTGILAEHAQTRTAAGLFDVSHMGQVRLTAKPGQNAAKAIEALVPGDIAQILKDTVNVGPGERYDVIWQAREPGRWLLHCHIPHHTTNNNTEEAGGGGLMAVINVTS